MRERAESFFGVDLGGIRIHTDELAAQANDDIDARAFSIGNSILVRDRAALSDPRVVAHELVHVLQPPASPQATLVGTSDEPSEQEAQAFADRFARGEAALDPLSARPRVERSAALSRDARHPRAAVLDADYLLYEYDRNDYDAATQHYYLSPWDRAHLTRRHGLYFLELPSGLDLISPPEIRRRAGARGVLLPVPDLQPLIAAGRAGASRFCIDLARSALNIAVVSVTLSAGSDRDFTRPALPAGVARVLASPLPGVGANDIAEVNASRARAAVTPQERTLSMANARGEELPMREFQWSDRMDGGTHSSRPDLDRMNWYIAKLAPFQAQLLESALNHHLPMQLLAAVVLNELLDIDVSDVLQSGPGTFRGSLGIAQLQVDTARQDRLVDLSSDAHRTGWALSGLQASDINDPAMVDFGERLRTGQLLQVPQVAIEAAAREVELLLTRMGENRDKPWQVQHGFTAPRPEGDTIYAHVGLGSPADREGMLADAVAGAYNSPDVIIASDTSKYNNATIHGFNACMLAKDLYRFQLFRKT